MKATSASNIPMDDQEQVAESSVACTHCGLPVPRGLIEPDRDVQFCCHGCAGAYDLIHASGLDSFYRMADAPAGERATAISDAQAQFHEFDAEVFQTKYARTIDDHESQIELSLEGIHCGACVWLIEKLPSMQAGVISATANWARRTVSIRWASQTVSLSQIARTLNRIGYRPSPVQPSQKRNRWNRENQSHLVRIGIAAACAGNNMIISAALYFGMFSHMSAGMSGLLRVASGVVGVVALMWPGRIFLKSAIQALRTRTPHMDLPIALGLSVGTLAGIANVIRGTGEIYFDSLSVLIFLLLVGRWIQFRQQSKAADAVEMLYRLTPQMTRKMVDGVAVETLVDLVEVDDLLQVLPGDLFPVDGEIIDGQTRVDESILTGESECLKRGEGDRVAAGTRNESSSVTIVAHAIGSDTRLSQIVKLVEDASSQKPEMVLWANRVGGYFVAVVILFSVFTFGYWVSTDVETAIDRTIALLIVACPCALALATPLAIAVALGRAAKQRIMIKGGDVLQSLRKPGMIWLDKTGTITEGNLQVADWYGDTRWADIAAALERHSSHPVAEAIVRYADELQEVLVDGVVPSSVAHFHDARTFVHRSESRQGLGMTGFVGTYAVAIGNQKLMQEMDVEIRRAHSRIAKLAVSRGFSPCFMAIDGRVVAMIGLGDAVRSDAFDSVSQLQDRGWQVGILSGDHQQVVGRVAKRLGIAAEFAKGGVEPEMKLEAVRESAASGTVMMIGDGVNDSAALAAADVGIAVSGGAEASLAAAPVYFATPGLQPVVKLLSMADSTARTMKINLAVSLTYNFTFALLAFAGFINPLVAAILMPISSITVVALSIGSGRASGLQTRVAQPKGIQ